jgi:formylmethanofuran--tetrahydromethanopterin N-formyltransferase
VRNGVVVDDTFAEAFGMSATGLIVTADTARWAHQCAVTTTGFGTSVIGCGAECGIDRALEPGETPDGRPGVRVLMFGFSPDALGPQVTTRVGQCVLTAPGSACYAGLDGPVRIGLGAALRRFGDGHQTARRVGGRRYWRIPVMDGEFVCEHDTGCTTDAVGGGNLLVLGRESAGVLTVCERAVAAIARVPDVITPFPGGIVRSGSKVGSKYAGLVASTNEAFCPTLKGAVRSDLSPDTACVLEIVIDGLTSAAVAAAMRAGLASILADGHAHGVTRVSAGNYGGKLGAHHYHLKDLLG